MTTRKAWPLKVLLLEPEAISHKHIVQSLQQLGLGQFLSDDLEQGMADSLSSHVHLVILGLGYGMEENEFQLGQIRAQFPRSLIMGICPRVSSSERTRLLNEGLDFIMEKPFFVEELMSAIRAVLRRHTLPGGFNSETGTDFKIPVPHQ